MNVTNEEMALLQVILDVDHSYSGVHPSQPNGEVIELAKLWRKRGVKSSEFQLLAEEKFPLGSSSHLSFSPPLDSPSLSPRSSPSSTLFKEGVSGETKTEKKLKLTRDLVLASVPIDLTLRSSPAFLVAWASWVRSRLQFKPLPTLLAFEQHMKACARMGPKLAIRQIELAIASGWRAVLVPSYQDRKQDNRDKIGGSL